MFMKKQIYELRNEYQCIVFNDYYYKHLVIHEAICRYLSHFINISMHSIDSFFSHSNENQVRPNCNGGERKKSRKAGWNTVNKNCDNGYA